MNRVKNIEIDLNTYRIVLRFKNSKDPLILHFDTPSRKFYLSLIALIVHEMKQQDHPGYVHIRKHETQLKFLDDTLAGSHASGTIDGMWEKIRKAWHYSLPNLEEAAHFKIEERDHVPPYEKGGKYKYECTEDECDIWTSLFGIDEITNKWRFRFAFDEAWLDLSDVTIKLGDLKDDSAWDAFLRQLEKISTNSLTDKDGEFAKPTVKTYPIRWQLLAMAVVVLFVLLIGGAAILNRYLRPILPPTESVADVKPSIAVLPFINVSDDPDKDYFCDGITEELINSLARVKDLRVISRTSVFYFKNKELNLRTIAQKLDVDHILEGSVRTSGDQLKISAQLIKVKDDSHLWADTYDRKMVDIFDTQEKLAQEIACSLKSRMGCKEDELGFKRYTDNLEAYNLYLKGRYIWSTNKQKDMIDYFNKALELDPNYALAYLGLAEAYAFIGFFFGDSMGTSYIKAKEAALKALEIDNTLASAYAVLGQIQLLFDWDWKGSESTLKKAIKIDPENSMAHVGYHFYLRAIGQTSASVNEMKIALDLDPLSFFHNQQYEIALQFDGQADNAIKQAEITIEMFPNSPATMTMLGNFHVMKQNYDKGISILEQTLSTMKRKSSFTLGFLGYAYGVSGDRMNAMKILNECLERWAKGKFNPGSIANIYIGMNEIDKAFEWLNIAINEKDPRIFCLKTIPAFRPLHTDPRWSELMKKMGLEG
jgi:adenylate cyclase